MAAGGGGRLTDSYSGDGLPPSPQHPQGTGFGTSLPVPTPPPTLLIALHRGSAGGQMVHLDGTVSTAMMNLSLEYATDGSA